MDTDDILNLFDSGEEDNFDEVDYKNGTNDSLSTIFLKFVPPGLSTTNLTSIVHDINGLLRKNDIQVLGLYFKRQKSVLIEVVLNGSTKNWLIQLFEERNSVSIKNAQRRKKILDLCFGKFKIIIQDAIFSLVVISGTACVTVPCCTSVPPYGAGNGDIVNIIAGKLADNPSQIIQNFIAASNSDPFLPADKIAGVRVEPHLDYSSYFSLRIILTSSSLSAELLSKLNSIYRQVAFCSVTLHVIPKLLSDGYNSAISDGRDVKSLARIILKNDILTCWCNENEIISKSSQPKTPTNNNPKPSTSNSTNATLPITRPNIFDRLDKSGHGTQSTQSLSSHAHNSGHFSRDRPLNFSSQRVLKKRMKSVIVRPGKN
jgi:hypothetical protein